MNEEKIDVNGLDEDLVVLTTDDGVEHNFYHVATVDYKNEWYVFLQPHSSSSSAIRTYSS